MVFEQDGLIQVAETSRRATDEHGIHEELSLDVRAELELGSDLVHVQVPTTAILV